MVGVGCSAPTSSTARAGRPISSSPRAGGQPQVGLVVVLAPARERDLAGWRRRSSRRRVEDGVQLAPET
jgi:hypothetical protein